MQSLLEEEVTGLLARGKRSVDNGSRICGMARPQTESLGPSARNMRDVWHLANNDLTDALETRENVGGRGISEYRAEDDRSRCYVNSRGWTSMDQPHNR